MPIAWYIVPYSRDRLPDGQLYRYTAIRDYSPQIKAAGGKWSETEILGDRATVKVRATTDILSVLDLVYKRLPKNRLDDSLSDLPIAVKNALKNEILDMGYTVEEIRSKFGSDLGNFTLRDVLKFMARRRLKPRYGPGGDTIICDGIVQNCKSIEAVNSMVQ